MDCDKWNSQNSETDQDNPKFNQQRCSKSNQSSFEVNTNFVDLENRFRKFKINDKYFENHNDDDSKLRHSWHTSKYNGNDNESVESRSSWHPRQNSFWKSRNNFTPEEEEKLSEDLKESYGKNLDEFLTECFSKKFTLTGNVLLTPKVTSNLYSSEQWQNEELTELKRDLNSVKDKLNEFELNEWHKHTRSSNPADLVMRRLRRDMKVEFVTQAWCKFYEIVSTYRLIPKVAREEKVFYSYHLCEAPGAFVASLNHYVKLNHPDLEWYWMANSLNPYYEGNHLSEMINDDRFIMQTIKNWDFGPDLTGDITHPDYPKHLRNMFGDHQPHLVTADGSFDCQNRPEEQESSVSWLHLKEVLIALNILRKGGNFIIKMFTFFECDTVCLLYLLAASFDSLNVIKPATSKEGNSEVYVVCTTFKGLVPIRAALDKLLFIRMEQQQRYAMFPLAMIPRIFTRQIIQCATQFANLQKSVIERNIRLFPETNEEYLRKHFEFIQEKLYQKYIDRYQIHPLPIGKTITSFVASSRTEVQNRPPKVIETRLNIPGSHNDQVERLSLSTSELLQRIKGEISKISYDEGKTLKLVRMQGDEIRQLFFDLRFGKAIETVYSSQFCHGSFMRLRNELISAIGIEKYNIATADVESCKYTNDGVNIICDFSCVYMNSVYNEAQLESFRMIYHELLTLKDDCNFVLYSYPLLAQFNVNIVCLLRQFFAEIMFESPNTIHFKKASVTRRDTWMSKLSEIFKRYQLNEAVISCIPLKYITGYKNEFYRWVVEVNNLRVMHEINMVIEFSPR